MFGTKVTNPYEAVVAKATDEKQTDVNWDILLTVWDKVNEDGEQGARNCVAALQKRLVHRSANVHLFSLTLAGALVNNCGPPLHREISGKAFTQALVRLINDRSTHDSVKTAALKMIQEWVKEHPNDPDFDILVETYESLKRQGHRFPSDQPAPEPDRSRTDEALRREEEELQRALEESAKLAGVGASGSATQDYGSKALPRQPSATGLNDSYGAHEPAAGAPPRLPQRVRALYDFAGGQSPEELPFHKGDVIRVIDSPYNDWWRGELRGATGIFPRNYVEELPDAPAPAAASASSESELEAELFAQSAKIDRLLNMMRTLSSRGENLAENDELGELYNELMALRPKVVTLIKKYDQKGVELRSMNDKFGRAKSTYEGMLGYGPPSQATYPHQPSQQHGGYPDPRAHQQQQPQQLQYGAPPGQHPYATQQAEEERARRESEARAQREYEAQMIQYENDMAAWRAAQEQAQHYYAAQQQQQQQQQGHMPPPAQDPAHSQSHYASAPHPTEGNPALHPHEPPPAAASTQQWAAQASSQPPAPTIALAVDPTQPTWDGSQWVYPRQHAVVDQHPPAVASAPSPVVAQSYPSHVAPIASPPLAAATVLQQGYSAQTQPYPGQPYASTVGASAPPSRNVSYSSASAPAQSPPPPLASTLSTTSSIYGAPPQVQAYSAGPTSPSTGGPPALVDRMASLSVSSISVPPTAAHEQQSPISGPMTVGSPELPNGTVRHQLYDRPMPAASNDSGAPLDVQAYHHAPVPEAGAVASGATEGESGDDAAWQEYYRQKAEWDKQQGTMTGAGLPQA